MRAFAVVIFAVSMILSVDVGAGPLLTEINDELTAKEKTAIEKQKKILDEIAVLYAERSLERPKDFAACVREMFAMRRSNKCRDRFTHYYTPEDVKHQKEYLAGKFGGVGVELIQEDSYVVVLAPIGGTPAERAGIRAKDIILKVDGKEVDDINEASSLIRGKAGTNVTITVFRRGTKGELVFTLTREIINVQTVKWRLSSEDKKIGIIAIRRFDGNVSGQFAEAVIDLAGKGAKSIVIDLRNNPGGLVSSVSALLGLFANKTDTILTYRYRYSREVMTFNKMPVWTRLDYLRASMRIERALKIKSLRGIPTVVLINNGSASASEIFSGTMKDWGYPVVGEKSYGKGVGQELIDLSDGSRLALTTFEFLVGNRQVVIRDKGVEPTIKVKATEQKIDENKKDDKNDAQLMKALEVLQSCGKNDPARAYRCTRQ